MKKRKLRKMYAFAQRPLDNFSSVMITQGKYDGLIYRYGRMQLIEPESRNGELKVLFEYTPLKVPEGMTIDESDFVPFAGEILMDILQRKVEEQEFELREDEVWDSTKTLSST